MSYYRYKDDDFTLISFENTQFVVKFGAMMYSEYIKVICGFPEEEEDREDVRFRHTLDLND